MSVNGRELPLTDEEETTAAKLHCFGCLCCLCTLCLSWIPLCCYCSKMSKKYPSNPPNQVFASAAPSDYPSQPQRMGGPDEGSAERLAADLPPPPSDSHDKKSHEWQGEEEGTHEEAKNSGATAAAGPAYDNSSDESVAFENE